MKTGHPHHRRFIIGLSLCLAWILIFAVPLPALAAEEDALAEEAFPAEEDSLAEEAFFAEDDALPEEEAFYTEESFYTGLPVATSLRWESTGRATFLMPSGAVKYIYELQCDGTSVTTGRWDPEWNNQKASLNFCEYFKQSGQYRFRVRTVQSSNDWTFNGNDTVWSPAFYYILPSAKTPTPSNLRWEYDEGSQKLYLKFRRVEGATYYCVNLNDGKAVFETYGLSDGAEAFVDMTYYKEHYEGENFTARVMAYGNDLSERAASDWSALSPVYQNKGKWIQDRNGWWYRRPDGTWPANGWAYIEGTWYFFDTAGYIKTGWINTGGLWYYLEPSGAMVTGWKKVGNTWYYMNEWGAMTTGWVNDNGTWYFMDASGAMKTGWVYTGAWYYMNASGAMMTGWVYDGGTWYFMDGSGAMLANTSRYINGKTYYFNGSGACTNP